VACKGPNQKKTSLLLWEYDYDKFNFDKSYKIVIDRVLERWSLKEWKEIFHYYGTDKILQTIDWSAQLDEKTKCFSRFFLKSELEGFVLVGGTSLALQIGYRNSIDIDQRYI